MWLLFWGKRVSRCREIRTGWTLQESTLNLSEVVADGVREGGSVDDVLAAAEVHAAEEAELCDCQCKSSGWLGGLSQED